MNASELRLGNWVHHQYPMQVVSIYADEILCNFEGNQGDVWEFDPKDLLALYREVDDRDEEIVVIYHSHTETEAYPSRTDIAYASEPGAHYVLVSSREEIAPAIEFRSYRIIDGEVTEEEVSITD
jgi:proteasome lid subunit RPN8/RPN11